MAITNGGPGPDDLDDTSGDDTINAGAGDDRITVTDGSDTVHGDADSDTLIVDWHDSLNGVSLLSGLSVDATDGGYDGTYSDQNGRRVDFFSIETFLITTGSGDDAVVTGQGNDLVDVGSGLDQADGGAGTDGLAADLSAAVTPGISFDLINNSFSGVAGASFTNFEYFSDLKTGEGWDFILTSAANLDDRVDAGGGDDTIWVLGGNDVVAGGSGTDSLLVHYEDATGAIVTTLTADASGGYAGSYSDGTSHGVSFTGIENFNVGGGSGNDQVTTGDGNDFIFSGAGNDIADAGGGFDIVQGGPGDDMLDGGAGIDTLTYVDATAGVTVSLADAGPQDTGGAGTDTVSNFEDLTGSYHDDHLTGDGGDNVITALGGSDTIDGGAGVDTISYLSNVDGVQVTADAPGHGAVVEAPGVTDTFSNVEKIFGTFTGDTFTAAAGTAMTFAGEGGDDVYTLHGTSDTIVEDPNGGTDEVRTDAAAYTLAANVENLTGTGSTFQTLRGNAGDNAISTSAAGGFVDFSAGGTDTGIGAGGVDVFYFGAALDHDDQANGGAGKDVAALQGDYSGGVILGDHALDNIETLSILSHTDNRFGGNTVALDSYNLTSSDANVAAGQTLTVNASTLEAGENFTFDGSAESNGNFFIYGGKGDDHLTGGSGLDVFFFAEDGRFGANDSVNGGAGSDILVLRGNYTIDMATSAVTNIETVTLMSGSDARFFSTTSNFSYDIKTAEGTVANGATMTFNAGGLHAGETFHFDGSAETDGGAFRIFGGADADVVTGGAGADLLYGGLGADMLTGGGGADTFRYQATGESTAASRDQILDFASGDRIDLSRIDANSATAGNQAFALVSAFGHHAGELVATNGGSGNVWTISGDTNGDGTADFQLLVTVADSHTIAASDFLL